MARDIDLNVIPREFDGDINQISSITLLQNSSSNHLPFDLNDEILRKDDTQIGEIFHQPNLNIDGDVNELSDPSIPAISSSNSFLFDLNDELFMEDETHMGDTLHESNCNTELNGDINQSQAPSTPQISLSSHLCGTEENMDEMTDLEFPEAPTSYPRKKNWSNDERRAIYESLLEKSIDKKLKKGVTKLVASQFSVTMRTVQRIWKRGKESGAHVDVSHRMTKNCGRKRVQIDLAQIREIPLAKRTTIRSLSCALNLSQATIQRYLKSRFIRRHSNPLKSSLSEENKIARLHFCISMLHQDSLSHDPTFSGMYNIIHIDEKWFYMTKKSENYYLLQEEEEPLRTCRSKNFIGKVMFLVVIARPRFDSEGVEYFDGKIGVFPPFSSSSSITSSKSRESGTISNCVSSSSSFSTLSIPVTSSSSFSTPSKSRESGTISNCVSSSSSSSRESSTLSIDPSTLSIESSTISIESSPISMSV